LSRDGKIRRIEELNSQLLILREKKEKANAELRRLAEKREKLNEKFRVLRSQVIELKNERDRINLEIKELKMQEGKMKNELAEKIEKIKLVREELRKWIDKTPANSPEKLGREIENLEWKIQTTPLDLQEEKKLVERIKKLENQLEVHVKIEQLKQKNLGLMAEIKALKTRMKLCRDKILEKVEQSRFYHQKFLEKSNEAREIKKEVDLSHQSFVNVKTELNGIRMEIAKILNEIKRLKEEITMDDEINRRKNEELLLKNLEAQALKKLERGEKLTWEEFKIIMERKSAQG